MQFKEYAFRDLLTNIVDNRGRTCPTAEKGIPLIATNCIKNTGLYPVYEKLRYVSEEVYRNWFRGHPKPGDMIFVCKGSPGRVCWVPEPVPFCIAQDMVAIRADETKVYPKYLFALLRSKEVQHRILNMHVGTSIPHFKKGDFANLYLQVPEDKGYQKEVGDTYFSLCEKIENNYQFTHTLEQMAQAIFKSWFVEFEPVKAKLSVLEEGRSEEDALLAAMEAISGKSVEQLATLSIKQPERYAELRAIAALFPSAMQDSELGEIPEGWEATRFGEVSVCLDKHRVPLSKAKREKRKGLIPYYGATSIMDYVDEFIFDGIYLLLGEDGSVLKKDDTPFTQYIWGKAWVNNHAHVLQGANGVSTEQLMLFMKNQNLAPYVTGAVQLKLNQKNMNSIPFIKADYKTCEAFSNFVEPIFSEFRNRHDESLALEETREALLPKLLSGEIPVKGAV